MSDALHLVQRRFLAGIIDGTTDAESLIVDDERVGAARRLDIYRNNYRASLCGVLADHYERLHAYLGDAQFDNLARAYLAAHPSVTRNLRDYGGKLSAVLARHYPDDGELAELAQLDWAMRHAFDAADTKPLDAAGVAELGDAWIDQALMLHPSATLFDTRHNVVAIWSALDREETPPEAERLVTAVPLLVWRHNLRPQFRSLPELEAAALAMIAERCSFTDLSAAVIERQGEEAAMQSLSGWLGLWLAEEVLVLAA